jgi:hypothetical protein
MTLTDKEITLLYCRDYLVFARTIEARVHEELRKQKPVGWQLVPKEPTLAMCKVLSGSGVDGDRESPQADYAALLDAAPTFDV